MLSFENGRPGAVLSGKPGSLFLDIPENFNRESILLSVMPASGYRASLPIAVIPDGSYRESIWASFRMDTRHKLRV